jgi:hypothetical protein
MISIKKDEIVLFARKWMELEIFMVREHYGLIKTSVSCFLSFVEARGNKTNQNKTKQKPRSP